MKRFFSALLVLMALFSLFSCGTPKVDSDNTGSQVSESIYSDLEKKIIGTWETSFNGHTTIVSFESGGKGLSTTDLGNEFSFTYKIINDHQFSLTMETIEGNSDSSVYDFSIDGDTLIFDNIEYTRK